MQTNASCKPMHDIDTIIAWGCIMQSNPFLSNPWPVVMDASCNPYRSLDVTIRRGDPNMYVMD
jgi:hypothetical protein